MNSSSTQRPRKVLILGALSGVAEATARAMARDGAELALVARNEEKLAAVAKDLELRGAGKVVTAVDDLASGEDVAVRMRGFSDLLGGIDTIFLFYGVLGDQDEADRDSTEVRRIIDINFTSAAEWMTAGVDHLENSAHEKPAIVVASSVAGDRGRRSNYAYGAAKGGLSVFAQGLAHRMAATGKTRVCVAKLGFVKTAMTAHLDRSGPLWAEPETVAEALVRALDKGGPIIYVPGFWRFIMLAVRATPAFVFNKVNL
ncbi:MAG: SDR family NAD(P)-dependent oxidoreductase [Pseudomonadota bacterium]